MADDYRPFIVERPGKNGRIKLGPEAKWWAQQHGMTLREMARYLLQRDEQGDAQAMIGGESESAETTPTEAQIAEEARDFLPSITPSENIEDRRQEEPIFGPGVMRQIWGEYPHNTAPQVQTYGPNPLANALGFGDVGQRPAPVPQTLGPYQPRWPQQFGSFQYGPID
jgi:hypothetical protein